jgi:Flp pilus assembly protein TadD
MGGTRGPEGLADGSIAAQAASRPAGLKAPQSGSALELERGVGLQRAGDLQGAVNCFKRAIELDSTCFAAYNQLGGVFASLRDWETALIFVRAASALSPESAEIHGNLGHLALKQGQAQAAVESYRQAAALRPEDAGYANALGHALLLAGQRDEAEVWMRRAILLDPGYAEAYANLGFLASLQRRPASSVEQYCWVFINYRSALARKPDLAQAHVNLSHSLLRRGAFAEGWKEHEWRWRWDEFPSPRRGFTQPQWGGERIEGARILLHAEQGFGDTLQFARYVPQVVGRGAQVVLEVHPELKSLFEGTFPGVEVLSRGDRLPHFDWQCPLLSLPLAFGTEVGTIPAEVPYLTVQGLAPAWLGEGPASDLRVGLVWAGGAINLMDRVRSLSLSLLAPLWEVPGVSFYSLQRGPAGVEAESSGAHFAGFQPQTGDFAASAAAVAQLDLVVTVDTSVAHLAGALGKPVWVLLPLRSDWRWMKEREDSPWYPSARLFRQTVDGDWSTVVERVRAELGRVAVERAEASRRR